MGNEAPLTLCGKAVGVPVAEPVVEVVVEAVGVQVDWR